MFDLSPAKLLLVFVVIMIVIGPDKLPSVARQLGAALETLRNFHAKVESEVRESIPNLPSTATIARMARSPSALLNTLMDTPADQLEDPVPDPAMAEDPEAAGEEWPIDTGAPMTLEAAAGQPASANGTAPAEGPGPAAPAAAEPVRRVPPEDFSVPVGDPNMN
jgi:sec-independent protein translocase protein TatB